jgi:3-deoxy-D-manno-octulosonic-acid transferase
LHTIYTLLILIYGLAIRLVAVFSTKAKLWVQGRRGLLRDIDAALKGIDRGKNKVVWFHASSLGEFEQGRPVIEEFRKSRPHDTILLSFYSPSGYEIRKNYDQADHVFYLPLDTPWNARRWMDIVRPEMAIFIKYDFWFNFIRELHERKVPVYFISSVFRQGQVYFRWYGG